MTTAQKNDNDQRITYDFTPTGNEQLRTIADRDTAGAFATRQTTTWNYYANTLLRDVTTRDAANNVLETHTVGYIQNPGGLQPIYVNGHRVSDQFKLKSPTGTTPCWSSTCTATYDYDGRDRLKQENDGHGTTTTYTLDGSGNITEERTNGTLTRTATYPDGRLATETVGGQTRNFLYDPEGNLDCVVTSGTTCPAWGTNVAPPSQLLADYAYDPFDRLVAYDRFTAGPRRTLPTTTTTFSIGRRSRLSHIKLTAARPRPPT